MPRIDKSRIASGKRAVRSCAYTCSRNTLAAINTIFLVRRCCRHDLFGLVIYGKINVHVPPPPVFIGDFWNYSKADVQNIQKAILDFNWRKAFEFLSVDSKSDILNERLLNIQKLYPK